MTHSYPYRPLVGSSVRLIHILDDEPSQSLIRCKLMHMPLDVSPPPEYIAVSYTWGDSKSDRRFIQLDGYDVPIPENLWHALWKIRIWAAMDPAREHGPWQTIFFTRRPWLLWADAICINQADTEEKCREIPRMMEIFGSAKEVLGWLGHLLPRGVDPNMLTIVLDKARDIGKISRADGKNWTNLWLGTRANLQAGLGEEDMDAFTKAVFAIAHLPWFSRLWIIQEFALARAPVVLALGPHLFDAIDFHDLLTLFSRRSEWFLAPVDIVCPLAMGRIREQHHFHTGLLVPPDVIAIPESNNELNAFAQRLHGLLARASTAPFRSTIKHDMIYGILSMAVPPDPIPPQLAINYSLPWTEVCRQYAKFIAERTGAISFLTRGRPFEMNCGESWNKDEISSWVPDFSLISIIIGAGPWYHVEKDRFQGCVVTFSEDGNAMTVDGHVLGRPIALTSREGLISKQEDHYNRSQGLPFDRADAREFVDEILKPAADQQGRSLDDVLASWIGFWEQSVDRQIVDSEMPIIKRTFKRWIKGNGPDKLDLEKPKIGGRVFSERGRSVWRRLKNKSVLKNWIVTSDGRGWMTLFLDNISPDDVIVVLRGLEENPAVLRGRQEDGCFKLLGLLIERVPLSDVIWERDCKETLKIGDQSWTKITIV